MNQALVREELRIPVGNGDIALAADVIRSDVHAPAPAVISMYPYHKDDVIGSLFDGPRRRLAAQGVSAVLVDMRGHGGSPGTWGAGFDLAGSEGADAADVVEWVAMQPWCDGNVGVWGVSYGGMMALAAATRRPPHLRAIVSVYGAADPLEDMIAPHGCPLAFSRYLWSAHMLAMDLCPPTRRDDAGEWETVWAERLGRLCERPGYAFEWQQHGDEEAYWNPRALDLSRIEVPALIIGGWYDVFLDATVRDFAAIRHVPRSLVIGPWLHVVPDLAEDQPFDWVGEMSAWWTRYLTDTQSDRVGSPTGPSGPTAESRVAGSSTDSGSHDALGGDESSALIYVRGSNRWCRYESWPPRDVRSLTLYAMASGVLSPQPAQHPRDLTYEPRAVTGWNAGVFDPLGTGYGRPEDQRNDDTVSLSFQTEPLGAPIELAGRPVLEFHVSRQPGEDLRLAVKVSDVAPDGSSELLTTGWHSIGSDIAELSLQCICSPVAAVVNAGHRLRVSIASSDFPRYWPTPSFSMFGVSIGGGQGCALSLPVVQSSEAKVDVALLASHRPVGNPAAANWVQSGPVGYRRLISEPGTKRQTQLVLRPEFLLPSGSTLRMDERFAASVDAGNPSSARVDGDIWIEVEDGPDWQVQVHVRAHFDEQSAGAIGVVHVNGAVRFEHAWGEPIPTQWPMIAPALSDDTREL